MIELNVLKADESDANAFAGRRTENFRNQKLLFIVRKKLCEDELSKVIVQSIVV